MSKHIHIHVGKTKTTDADDSKRVASILRRCSMDAKRLSNDLEALSRLVESGEDEISLSSANMFKEKLLALNLPAR